MQPPTARSVLSTLPRLVAALSLAAAGLAPLPASAVTIDWVAIGSPGNAADTPSTNCYAASCGSVSYEYQISKYEVTNTQYAEFLNAADASGSNTLALYSASMNSDATNGGISFVSGNASGSKYVVKSGFASKPVTYVSFYDTLRFSNWLNNGQGGGSTETGAYTLLGGTATPSNGLTVTRNASASIFLTSENEWYKAAYYDAVSTSYFDYPAGTHTATVCAAPTATANRANCDFAVGAATTVGAYTGSASPYGTYDQGGNLWEWNEEILSGSLRGLRGGGWFGVANALAASAPGNSGDDPTIERDFSGFRVASPIPEPGTGLLVMTGLAGLAVRRRRPAKTL
jgi:formylglycine-generating enzyme required for sulfatase activity